MKKQRLCAQKKLGHPLLVLLTAAVIAIGAAGCDLSSLYGLYGLSDPYGLGSLGFIPDASVVQSVNDYRQSVFESANDAWDAYIRE